MEQVVNYSLRFGVEIQSFASNVHEEVADPVGLTSKFWCLGLVLGNENCTSCLQFWG